MRARLALLALLVCSVGGCSNREHSNPLDPTNPRTGGRPAEFAALAGNSLVVLTWRPVSISGILGYRLFRRVLGETAFTPISDLLPPMLGSFGDYGVTNGVDLDYRLYFVLADGSLSGLPAEDRATPGPLRPWVSDLSGNTVRRLTPDGRHVAFEYGDFSGPTKLAVDVSSSVVWICDTFASRIVLLVPGIPAPRLIEHLTSPVAVAVDPATRTGWVCDQGANRVLHFAESGLSATPSITAPLLDPIAIELDPIDGTLWVCENAGNEVRHFDRDGTPLWGTSFTRPSRVAVDSVTHLGWVTSFSAHRILRIAANGVPFDTLSSFQGPIGIAIDHRRGRIWVADALANQVVALRRDGTVEFRIGGLSEVREIAVDLGTGEAWATVPAAGAVARLSRTGQVLRTLGGLGEPDDIALDPGVPGLLLTAPPPRAPR